MESLVGWLILAWFLSLFNIDTYFIEFFSRLLPFTVDIATYYITFGCIGLLFGFFGRDK